MNSISPKVISSAAQATPTPRPSWAFRTAVSYILLKQLSESRAEGAQNGCEDCAAAKGRIDLAVAALLPGFEPGMATQNRRQGREGGGAGEPLGGVAGLVFQAHVIGGAHQCAPMRSKLRASSKGMRPSVGASTAASD